jgi:hypothetical protein
MGGAHSAALGIPPFSQSCGEHARNVAQSYDQVPRHEVLVRACSHLSSSHAAALLAQLRIYEHLKLCHVPELLKDGCILDGSSWFLEAFNKTWKDVLVRNTSSGGCGIHGKSNAVNEMETPQMQCSAAQQQWRPEKRHIKANKMDTQALKRIYLTSHPDLCQHADRWKCERIQKITQHAQTDSHE